MAADDPGRDERAADVPAGFLNQFYDEYPRIERAFTDELSESLHPRGPDLLYELVEGMNLPPGASAVDVGCAAGHETLELAARFGFDVVGVDPLPRHLDRAATLLEARAASRPDLRRRVRFASGDAEHLPLADASIDLVWCRDVLTHVPDVGRAYAEFARVLRPAGRVLVYQTVATELLEPREAAWLWRTMGVYAASADRSHCAAAVSRAGLVIDGTIDLRSEWGEWADEQSGQARRRLLHAARLRRDPERYVRQFGEAAYRTMLGDCLWHIYAMIGKLDRIIFVLSKPRPEPTSR